MFIRTFPYDKQTYRVRGEAPAWLKGGQPCVACAGIDGCTLIGATGAVFSRAKRPLRGWPHVAYGSYAVWNDTRQLFIIETDADVSAE